MIKNGMDAERFVEEKLNVYIRRKDEIDFEMRGENWEVKSCKRWVKDGKSRRRGRFHLRKDQHEHVDRYVFVLKDKEMKMKIIKKEKLNINFNNAQIKNIPWNKIWRDE